MASGDVGGDERNDIGGADWRVAGCQLAEDRRASRLSVS